MKDKQYLRTDVCLYIYEDCWMCIENWSQSF